MLVGREVIRVARRSYRTIRVSLSPWAHIIGHRLGSEDVTREPAQKSSDNKVKILLIPAVELWKPRELRWAARHDTMTRVSAEASQTTRVEAHNQETNSVEAWSEEAETWVQKRRFSLIIRRDLKLQHTWGWWWCVQQSVWITFMWDVMSEQLRPVPAAL